ncbi:39944_t:CDS:2 [Gigaspora margarita]|uniref:39944_t:CDS:1 n=1 Tax=Gigaspora margarita TaxID=4874 RepID=A0ABN7UZZ6_GIGMA|nr:39944_t:CDS:2 [Gigaspora margarita]
MSQTTKDTTLTGNKQSPRANITTFPLTPNKLRGNVTNVINDTNNPTQSKKIRTQTAET